MQRNSIIENEQLIILFKSITNTHYKHPTITPPPPFFSLTGFKTSTIVPGSQTAESPPIKEPSKAKHLLKSTTTIHTTPEKIISEILNFGDGNTIRKKGISKNVKCLPSPQVVFDSIDEGDDSSTAGSVGGGRILIVVSYKPSAKNNLEVLEFFHFYETKKALDEDGEGESYIIGFCTIQPSELPLFSMPFEEYRKDISDKYVVIIGWEEMGSYNLKAKDYDQTEVTLYLIIDVQSNLLSKVKDYFIENVSVLNKARELFDRGFEIDGFVSANFVNNIIPNTPSLTSKESATIQNCKLIVGFGDENRNWKRIPGTLNDNVAKFKFTDENNQILVKGVVEVDEAASTIVAHLMDFTSNERNHIHIQNNGHLVRSSSYELMTHTCNCTAEIDAPKPMKNRIFSWVQVWSMGVDGNPNSFVIAIVPDKDYDGATHSSTGAVVGSTCGIFVINSFAPRVSNVALIQTTDLKIKGAVGDFISNYTARYSLAILDELFEKYQRDAKSVDSEKRLAFVDNIEIVPPLMHNNLKQECIALATDFEADDGIPLIKLNTRSRKFNLVDC
jgi:hypothetical protein